MSQMEAFRKYANRRLNRGDSAAAITDVVVDGVRWCWIAKP